VQSSDFYERINAIGIVPVVAMERVEHALPLADALLAGGIPLVEITFRTSVAEEVIRVLSRQRPNLLVGAGTVITPENAKAACNAGARFAVAPGLNPALVQLTGALALPFVPGVATASEVERALALGCHVLKFFPAELLGGVEMLNALRGPYGHTGVRFIPTGGVKPANLAAYIGCKAVAAVGGTWLAKAEDLAEGKWDAIQERCQVAVEIVRTVRSASSR
jgi:2-dehydro-3-deoxyphosphogluconate aldolase/(4S)-4-hydroxy-2-oxoglutarate aldolase